MCVCSCVCKWLSSGFIRLQWCLDSRKSSTNRTEWCRNGQKAPLEFLQLIFSLPYFYPLTLFQSLTPPPPSSLFHSSLHQQRSAFSALAVTRSRCCSTNFSHPFIPAIRPFPKSTLSQRGEAFSHWLLLHGNFSLFCSFFCFFHNFLVFPLFLSSFSLLNCPFYSCSLFHISVSLSLTLVVVHKKYPVVNFMWNILCWTWWTTCGSSQGATWDKG